MELRAQVEEFLVINERRKAGIATAREEARWHELHARLTANGSAPAPSAEATRKDDQR